MAVPTQIKEKALSYLGALTINGLDKDDEDVDEIFERVYPVLEENERSKLIPIRLAIIAATALDNYADKLTSLKEEYQRQKAEIFKPKYERNY